MSVVPQKKICCIPECKITNRQGKLYKFPFSKELFPIWKTILERKFPNIKITTDKVGRCGKFVCFLHFEEKYIKSDGNRHRFAIPTLFTQTEIDTRKPACPMTIDISGLNEYTQIMSMATNSVAIIETRKCSSSDDISEVNKAKPVDSTYTREDSSSDEHALSGNLKVNLTHRRLKAADCFHIQDHTYAACEKVILIGIDPPEKPATEQISNEDNNTIHYPDAEETPANEEPITEDKSRPNDSRIPDPNAKEYIDDIPSEPDSREASPIWQHCDDIVEDEDHYWSEQYIHEPLPFSWQTPEELISVEDHFTNLVTLNLDVTEENKFNHSNDESKKEYYCNNCKKEIISFRYTCVQCENFDLCRACDGELLHPHHYMLRVPSTRPLNEVKSILDAIRERIKILIKLGQLDGVEIKQEEEETSETQPEATSQEAVSEVRAWTPTELSHTHMKDTRIYTLRSQKNRQDQNVPDVSSETEEESEIAGSETEEWLDETMEYPEDNKRGKVHNTPDPLSLVAESENTAPELGYPLSITQAELVPPENVPPTDTSRRNIATKFTGLEYKKSRQARLGVPCTESDDFVSIENINRKSPDNAEPIEGYPGLDEEIRQALNEIWHSDSIPAAEKTEKERHEPYQSIRTKISNFEKKSSKIDVDINKTHNLELVSVSVKPSDNNEGIEKSASKVKHVSIIKRNISDKLGLVSVIKLNLPDNYDLEPIKENPSDNVDLEEKTNYIHTEDERFKKYNLRHASRTREGPIDRIRLKRKRRVSNIMNREELKQMIQNSTPKKKSSHVNQ